MALKVSNIDSLLYDLYHNRKTPARGDEPKKDTARPDNPDDIAEYGKRRPAKHWDDTRPWPLGPLRDSNKRVAVAIRQPGEPDPDQHTPARKLPRGYAHTAHPKGSPGKKV